MADNSTLSVNPALLNYYTTIYAQAFSPCGKYLAAANDYGKIAIFNFLRVQNLDSISNGADDAAFQKPIYIFEACDGPVYALTTTEAYLISGGSGDIKGWSWQDILNKAARVVWSLNVPPQNDYTKSATNTLACTEKHGSTTLYAGCGDKTVHLFDLENLKPKLQLAGHTDYVHSLTLGHGNDDVCWSAGEDGQVLAWDSRTSKDPIYKIEPHKNETCHRPDLGKWIGGVSTDANDEWMVCGGGPALSLWHLRSLSCTTIFDTHRSSQTSVMFNDDVIISAGSEPHVYVWELSGTQAAKIPTTPFAVYSLIKQDNSHKQNLCVAGTSTTIDVCSNLKYKDFSLIFE